MSLLSKSSTQIFSSPSHLLNIETTKGIALKSPDGVNLLNPVECKNRLQIHRVFQKIQIEGLKSRIEGKEREMQSFLASSKRQLLAQDGFQGSSSMSDANGP
jgi:hypothetical protein